MKRFFWLAVALLSWPAAASAITVDGALDAEYGSALAVQDTPTGFGDNQNELNAAYGKLSFGDLSLLLTGNMQSGDGPNHLVIFVDSRVGGGVAEPLAGGFGKLGSIGGAATDDWGNDTDGGAGTSPTPGGGSILDPGFNPDVSIEIELNFGNYYTHIIDMTLPNEPNDNRDIYLGENTTGSSSVTQTYSRPDANSTKGHGGSIQHAFDNSNTAGVNGFDFGSPPGPLGDPLSATTGYEVRLSSKFLANDGQPIKIMAFVTNNSGDYLSNQFLGQAGVAGAINLMQAGEGPGGAPLFDAQQFSGNQYFTVPGLPADFNGNGKVDAADYVLWRQLDGTADAYELWRRSFGAAVSGSGVGSGLSSGVVPEAGSLTLALTGMLLVFGCARRK